MLDAPRLGVVWISRITITNYPRIIYSIDWAVLATWFIRPEISGKRRLSWYFTLIISWEQQNGQNPSMVTKARQTLDKTGYISLNHRLCWLLGSSARK
jgi:hypothetical protein